MLKSTKIQMKIKMKLLGNKIRVIQVLHHIKMDCLVVILAAMDPNAEHIKREIYIIKT